MNCDQAFDALTSCGASRNDALALHLNVCPRCRDMADILSPALELLAPASLEDRPGLAGEVTEPTGHRPSGTDTDDWIDTAPWRSHVQSARRTRRDGLKIVGAIALIAVFTIGFASLGREGSSPGFLSPLSAAECIRESTEPMAPENAVAACVSCHLQLTERQLAEPAQVKAETAILKCVDCHMAGNSDGKPATARLACLFHPQGDG